MSRETKVVKFGFHVGLVLLISFSTTNIAGQSTVLIADYFNDLSDWTEFYLSGDNGTYSYENDGLVLTCGSGTEYGLYHSKPISGNYYVEANFGADDAVALVLIKSVEGVPDFDNYVMVTVNNRSGKIYFNQYDKQNGVQNVHDKYNKVPDSDFEIKLDGTVWSVPFTGTRKKIRIAHDNLANVFRFLVGTTLSKNGFVSHDWLEVSPIYSWMESGQEMHVGLMVRNESDTGSKTVNYRNVKVVRTPEDDQDDSKTGFQAVAREFNWSGWNGQAVVVSFGDEFEYTDSNIKLVFWDRANHAPMWLLNNQLMHSWQFGERKGGGFEGCAEAMSDRQMHGQELEILENNNVRKVIRWKQYAYFPNYNYPGEGSGGSDMPYFEEYWTIYPDGTGTRRFVDVPKLDGSRWGVWPEFIEAISIGGSLINAGDYSGYPALTITSMEGDLHNFHSGTWTSDILNYDQIIMSAHYNNGPDVFLVYNNNVSYTTNDGYQLEGRVSWHCPSLNFSHWPVNRQPYGRNTNDPSTKSLPYHKFDASSNALGSFGRYLLGQDWSANYKINSDGRKYRDYIMLVGINEPNNYTTLRKKTQTWLEPGLVVSNNPNIHYKGASYAEKVIQFEAEEGESSWKFLVSPSGNYTILNPVFKCNNWSGSAGVTVRVNGDAISGFRSALVDNQLLVWIEDEFSENTSFEILPDPMSSPSGGSSCSSSALDCI